MQLFFCALFVLSPLSLRASEPLEFLSLRTSEGKTHGGPIIEVKEDGSLEFFDLTTNASMVVRKDEVRKLTYPATLEDVTAAVGLPAVAAWHLVELDQKPTPTGKVVKVTPQVVYLSLGTEDGIRVDEALLVFRDGEEVRDPDTGELLAREQKNLCELEVVEVLEKVCKAKIRGDFEVTLEVGDRVRPLKPRDLKIALFPISLENGLQTNVGEKLLQDITTTLVNRDLSVVARDQLAKSIGELQLQQSEGFDPKEKGRLGKLAGADVIVSGKIVISSLARDALESGKPVRGYGTAYVRGIKAETGDILFAVSDRVSITRMRVAARQKKPTTLQSYPTGAVKHSGHHYWVSTELLSWDDARKKCRALGGDLVCIESQDEQRFLERITARFRPRVNFWIGLTPSEGKVVWVNGGTRQVSAWANEMNRRYARQVDKYPHHILGRRVGGKWEVVPKGGRQGFICEWDH